MILKVQSQRILKKNKFKNISETLFYLKHSNHFKKKAELLKVRL